MNVSLTPESEELIRAEVESGRFHSASDVVDEALRLLHEREIALTALRVRMDEGIASLDRGEGVDGEEFMQRMIDELDLEEANRKAG